MINNLLDLANGQEQHLLNLLTGQEQLGTGAWIGFLIMVLSTAFQVWMFIDAWRRREYVWAVLIFIFSIFTAFFYYFLVYRPSGGGNPLAGFELPGAADRRQIKTLEDSIHHLDKPHHHLQLGDIYFNQGKLAKAEACYRAAYARDAEDEDIRAHLGACLVRRGQAAEGLPLLRAVAEANPKHDYGFTGMALAEGLMSMQDWAGAAEAWQRVLQGYSYPRARVQYAETLLKLGRREEAAVQLREVAEDEPHVARFQRKRDAVWFGKARRLLRSWPAA